MPKIKPELISAEEHKVVILQNFPNQLRLVKTNRFLLLLVLSLMAVVLIMGVFLFPTKNMLDELKTKQTAVTTTYALQNPVLSAEINILKGQLVGLISGSIESKLRVLEENIRMGSITSSLGTIQDLKNDVKILRTYSEPEKKQVKNRLNEALLKEVSHLKNLIYLTLTSCGLMIAAIGGIWIRNHYRLEQHDSIRAFLGKRR
jgi:hypothetical protein